MSEGADQLSFFFLKKNLIIQRRLFVLFLFKRCVSEILGTVDVHLMSLVIVESTLLGREAG